MAVFTLDEGRIAYQRRDELVVIEAYGPNTLRFRASPNATDGGRLESPAAQTDELRLSWRIMPP